MKALADHLADAGQRTREAADTAVSDGDRAALAYAAGVLVTAAAVLGDRGASALRSELGAGVRGA